MAEEEKKDNVSGTKTAEADFERMLNDADEVIGENKISFKDRLKNKKILIPLLLVTTLIIGGGLYLLLSNDNDVNKESKLQPESKKNNPVREEEPDGEETLSDDTPAKKEKVDKIEFKKIHSYKLEPFFIPLKLDKSEQNRFVRLQIIFLLSNQKFNREIRKKINVIRKGIYYILKNKEPKEFIVNHIKLKKTLKQEIIKVSNNSLGRGSGTVSDVLFTNFTLK